MAGSAAHREERTRHLEAIGMQPLPLPSPRRTAPIEYTDDLPDEAVELGAQGLSDTEIAAHWSIDTDTLREWANGHGELKGALSRARASAEAWWEEKARRALELRDNRFPAGAWAMVMKARFPNYRERLEVNGGIDVTHRLVLVDARGPGLVDNQTVTGAKPLKRNKVTQPAASLTGKNQLVIEGQATVIEGGGSNPPGSKGGVPGKPTTGAT